MSKILSFVIACVLYVAFSFPLFAASSATAEKDLAPLLDIPYRNDGASRLDGSYTLFADESASFTTPGFNCSGFVLAATRILLGTSTTVSQAKVDRLSDSGADSPHGQDWDFGWDILLNLTDGKERYYLAPDGSRQSVDTLDGFAARGFDLHKAKQLDIILDSMKKDHIYLLSFNRKTSIKNYSLLHYHVGLLVLNANGDALMYQTTTQSKKVYVRNISNPKERADFLQAFANTGKVRKYVAVLEIPM